MAKQKANSMAIISDATHLELLFEQSSALCDFVDKPFSSFSLKASANGRLSAMFNFGNNLDLSSAFLLPRIFRQTKKLTVTGIEDHIMFDLP